MTIERIDASHAMGAVDFGARTCTHTYTHTDMVASIQIESKMSNNVDDHYTITSEVLGRYGLGYRNAQSSVSTRAIFLTVGMCTYGTVAFSRL